MLCLPCLANCTCDTDFHVYVCARDLQFHSSARTCLQSLSMHMRHTPHIKKTFAHGLCVVCERVLDKTGRLFVANANEVFDGTIARAHEHARTTSQLDNHGSRGYIHAHTCRDTQRDIQMSVHTRARHQIIAYDTEIHRYTHMMFQTT